MPWQHSLVACFFAVLALINLATIDEPRKQPSNPVLQAFIVTGLCAIFIALLVWGQ